MKFQNVDECLSGQCELNYWTFYYQTWCRDASLWATEREKKKLVCCLEGQGHSEGLIEYKYDYLFWTADPFATKLGFMA